MPQEEVRIIFYRVLKCGYYKRGENEPRFGPISDVFEDLRTWMAGKDSLGETCPYDTANADPTFCLSLNTHSNGDCLFATWNATPVTEGSVASIDPNSPAARPTIDLTDLPPNFIPGYATYFWIIPQRSAIATIRFQHRQSGRAGLEKLVKHFMLKFAKYVVIDPDGDADHEILGYSNPPSDEILHLYPSFKTLLVRNPTVIDELRSRRSGIKKIIRKSTLQPNDNLDRSLLENIFRKLGVTPRQRLNPLDIKYEMKYTPGGQEFNQIVGGYHESSDDWDDIGFVLEKDETYWLSNSRAKETVRLEIERQNSEIINGQSLLNLLARRRSSLLQTLRTVS